MFYNPRTLEELQAIVSEQFSKKIVIRQVVLGNFEVGRTARAWIFLDDKKQAYLFVFAEARQTLGDVKKLTGRINVIASSYIPPRGDKSYFDDIGRKKFSEVFPGRPSISESDIVYYRTLAIYNPALIELKEIKNGEIKCFDATTPGNWRTVKRFSYIKVKTA